MIFAYKYITCCYITMNNFLSMQVLSQRSRREKEKIKRTKEKRREKQERKRSEKERKRKEK